MKVSVICVSHNGAEKLRETLPAFLSSVHAVQDWELILVDNASTDATADLMKDATTDPRVRAFSEPNKGKSFALNTALDHATGDLVIFWDDDVIAEPATIESYLSTAKSQPQISIFAGQIRPRFPGPTKPWMHRLEAQGLSFGATVLDLTAGDIPPGRAKGGNFMIRSEVARTVRFNTSTLNFGASTAAAGGEDTDFCERAAAQFGSVFFVPGALVLHIVQPHEARLSAVWKRAFRNGQSSVIRRQDYPKIPATLRSLFRLAVAAALQLLKGRTGLAAQNSVYWFSNLGKLVATIRSR